MTNQRERLQGRAIDNWTRQYDWQRKRQGDDAPVYRVEAFRPSWTWRALHMMGVL